MNYNRPFDLTTIRVGSVVMFEHGVSTKDDYKGVVERIDEAAGLIYVRWLIYPSAAIPITIYQNSIYVLEY